MAQKFTRSMMAKSKYFFLAGCIGCFLVYSCSEKKSTGVFSPNAELQSIPQWKYGKPVTSDIRPVKWKPGIARKGSSPFSGIDAQLLGAYDAIMLLQDFMLEVQNLIDDDPKSKLGKKLEKKVLKKAEDALDALADVPPDLKKALNKIEQVGENLEKIIDDGLLSAGTGKDFHNKLDAIIDAIEQSGGYEKCRGTKYAKPIKRSQGGVVHHCGHKIKVDKDALKQDSELSIHVLDSEDVIVDYGPDGWFNKQVEITLNIEDMDLSGFDDDDIVMAWYDEATDTWYAVDTKYDQKKKKLIAKVWHFTQYTLSIR